MKTILTLLLFTSLLSFSQSVQNIDARQENGKVIITYDITGGKPGQVYSLNLYYSRDNFATPLKQVTGDVGLNIEAGSGKKIVWEATLELGEFDGEIIFKIKGAVVIMPYVFVNPVEGKTMRRGKATQVKWTGGQAGQALKFSLLQEGRTVMAVGETQNTGAYAWRLPKKLAKGSYALQLESGSETVQSGVFIVKARLPLALKLAPIALVGGIIAIWPKPDTNNDLPAAPGPK